MEKAINFLRKLFSRKIPETILLRKEKREIEDFSEPVTFFEPISQQEKFNKSHTIDEFLNIKL